MPEEYGRVIEEKNGFKVLLHNGEWLMEPERRTYSGAVKYPACAKVWRTHRHASNALTAHYEKDTELK